MTSFHSVYDRFLSDVIDSYFINYEQQTISYSDLQSLLLSAIIMFKHPKQNLRDYDLEYVDAELVAGRFNIELTLEEIDILVSYMGIKWAENKLKRGRITELQYTGSDAKAINIKTYISGIKEIIDTLKAQNKILNNNYHMHDGYKLKTNKKASVRNSLNYNREL